MSAIRSARYAVPAVLLAGCAALGFLLPPRQAPAPAPAPVEPRVVGLVAATATAADPQQTLDATGYYRLPAGPFRPAVPLFLDSGAYFSGDPGAVIDAGTTGTVAVLGWKRGLVSDDHWQADGWHSKADTHLVARGTEWDLGPVSGLSGGWGSVKSITVRFSGHKNDNTTWSTGLPLCGLQSTEDGYADSPAPWQLTTWQRKVTFAVRTSDGITRKWSVAWPDGTADLDVTWSVDVTTGVCTCALNGASQTVDASLAGTGWGPSLRLRPNSRFPFGVLRMPPGCDDSGYRWSEGSPPDVTVKLVQVWTDAYAVGDGLCKFVGTDPRPQPSYPGGPSIPLAKCWTKHGSNWLWCVKSNAQAKTSSGSVNVTLSDLTVQTSGPTAANCTVAVGNVHGGQNRIQRVLVHGNCRGVQSMGLLNYPLTIADCRFDSCTDRGLWFSRVSGLSIDRVDLSYGGKCYAELWECTGVVRGAVIASVPGPPAQECCYRQGGGQMSYEYLVSDYEYAVPAGMPFLDLTPYSADGFATCARLTDCYGGTVPVAVSINPRLLAYSPNGAATPVRVRWDSLGDRTPAVCTVSTGVNPELVGLTAAAK